MVTTNQSYESTLKDSLKNSIVREGEMQQFEISLNQIDTKFSMLNQNLE